MGQNNCALQINRNWICNWLSLFFFFVFIPFESLLFAPYTNTQTNHNYMGFWLILHSYWAASVPSFLFVSIKQRILDEFLRFFWIVLFQVHQIVNARKYRSPLYPESDKPDIQISHFQSLCRCLSHSLQTLRFPTLYCSPVFFCWLLLSLQKVSALVICSAKTKVKGEKDGQQIQKYEENEKEKWRWWWWSGGYK